jgi:hypothetical protein
MSIVRRALLLSVMERYGLIALGLISYVLVARLLTPYEIGIYSVTAALVGVVHVIRDFGVASYLIQEQDLTRERRDTALGLSLLTGSVLFVAVFAVAPLVASLYGDTRMASILRVVSLNLLLLPFCGIALSLLRREMRFGQLLWINILAAVVGFVADNAQRLLGDTELWRNTWYDSTLPYWFLDRTMLNASILATSTCVRFADGRFYGWEGVGCCAGTCTHVWHYEQAMGRLFPELDILLRERVDFNPKVGFDETRGIIGHRGDVGRSQAVDGQAGTILRAYRDVLVSPDVAFLKRNWPQIKLATEWLMSLDKDGDGILDKPQANTLDATWYGKVP